MRSLPLFEAMDRRFAGPTTRQSGGFLAGLLGAGRNAGEQESDWRRETAEKRYLLGLMVEGRAADAMRVVARMTSRNPKGGLLPRDFLAQLPDGAATLPAYDVIQRLLVENPNLPLWSACRSLASRSGRLEQMIASAEAALKQDQLKPERRWRIQRQLHYALLNAERVDDAVAVLRELLGSREKLTELAKSNDDGDADGGGGDFTQSTWLQWADHLLELGVLLDNASWRDDAVQILEAALKADESKAEFYTYTVYEVTSQLSEVGRGPQAAHVLADIVVREQANRPNGEDEEQAGPDRCRASLIELLSVYHRAGRYDDVVALLDTAPLWGARDLADFYLDTDERIRPSGTSPPMRCSARVSATRR